MYLNHYKHLKYKYEYKKQLHLKYNHVYKHVTTVRVMNINMLVCDYAIDKTTD